MLLIAFACRGSSLNPLYLFVQVSRLQQLTAMQLMLPRQRAIQRPQSFRNIAAFTRKSLLFLFFFLALLEGRPGWAQISTRVYVPCLFLVCSPCSPVSMALLLGAILVGTWPLLWLDDAY